MQNLPNLLLVCDFDQTIAGTFVSSPNGIGVQESYRFAICQTFGEDSLSIYDDLGGLRNQAPSELVHAMLSRNNELLKKALKIYQHLASSPVLSGLEWQPAVPSASISEMLVRFKMHYLMEEICDRWPLPCTGFPYLMNTLEFLRNDINIELGILSSGHEKFIRKTFSTWGIPCPGVLVTEDDIRNRKYPADIKQRVKPSSFPLALFFHKWFKLHGKTFSMHQALGLKKRMIYFGDDPIKDGNLAKRVGIPFGWYRENAKIAPEISMNTFSNGSFHFSDWSSLGSFLEKVFVKEMIQRNLPLTEILARFQ